MVTPAFPVPKGKLMQTTISPLSKRAHFAKREPQLFTNDSSKTLIAQYHGANMFKKGKGYLEVTPAGMGMLDNIVVTFIPVDMRRRKKAKH